MSATAWRTVESPAGALTATRTWRGKRALVTLFLDGAEIGHAGGKRAELAAAVVVTKWDSKPAALGRGFFRVRARILDAVYPGVYCGGCRQTGRPDQEATMSTKTALSPADIERGYDDARWLGWGYLGERRCSDVERPDATPEALAAADEAFAGSLGLHRALQHAVWEWAD